MPGRIGDHAVCRETSIVRRLQSYFWVTKDGKRCWETRGLKKAERAAVAEGTFADSARDFSGYLNNWSPIEKIARST